MRTPCTNAAVILALATLGLCPLSLAALEAPTALLVDFKHPLEPGRVRAQSMLPSGLAVQRQVSESGVHRVVSTDGSSLEKQMALLKSRPDIAHVEYDWPVYLLKSPSDPSWAPSNGSNLQPYLQNMGAPIAWDITTGDSRVTVCVIDSGVNTAHPDLRPNLASPPGISTVGTANWTGKAGNSDWYKQASIDLSDELGHGTIVSGIIAAAGGNGVGMTGVAWKANVVNCKAFGDKLTTQMSSVLPCFDYCRARRADVIMTSWGLYQKSALLKKAVKRALKGGALLVAAAGNDEEDIDAKPIYPASFSASMPGVVSVGATDGQGKRSAYSNFGRKSVDLMAIGDGIYSTWKDSFITLNGTSFSAPLVAGAAALMASAARAQAQAGGSGGRLKGGQLKAVLLETVDVLPDLEPYCRSGGQLNIGRAVYRAAQRPYPQ